MNLITVNKSNAHVTENSFRESLSGLKSPGYHITENIRDDTHALLYQCALVARRREGGSRALKRELIAIADFASVNPRARVRTYVGRSQVPPAKGVGR